MTEKLVIISAPSGAGKTTLVKHLLDKRLNLEFSVSATTRARRGNEKEGVDYYFLSEAEFKRRIKENEFVEWEEVYEGLMYGTLRSEIERIRAAGNCVMFDVDVKGGLNLKREFGERAIAIFIMPPSIRELERRLVNRGTDCPSKINMRIEKAVYEITLAHHFDYIVINDDLEQAKNSVFDIVTRFIASPD
ncbi:MAG: guanylate kinase [Bacteroidales bacterium]|nr:guanylate kinase [Bacteroidales bacterium]